MHNLPWSTLLSYLGQCVDGWGAGRAGTNIPVLTKCWVHVYGRVYVRNRHLESVQLRTLEKMPVPFDVAFFVMLRQRGMKASDRADRPAGGL